MKVLIVTQYFWPENFRINDLAAALIERGHEVTVLTGIPNYPGGKFFPGYGVFQRRTETYRGCKVIRVPLIPRGRSSGIQLAINGLSFAASAALFSSRLQNENFDVMFVWESSPVTVGLPAAFIKRRRKIPLVLWVLDLWPESVLAMKATKSRVVLRSIEKIVQVIYGACDLILVASRGFIPSIERHSRRPAQIRYFPNWAEDMYWPARERAASPEVVPEGFRVMFAGNIGAAQGLGTLLEAAARLKAHSDIHWLIVGDGRMRDWVESRIRELSLTASVHLMGRFPPEAMPDVIALADVMLVTLTSDAVFALTVPGKVQSYLASGKPIVASLEGEGRKVVEDSGAGLVCAPDNGDALAQAVLQMYQMPPAERERMGAAGRRYCADNFKRTALMDRLEEWLRETAEKGVRG